MPSYLVLARKYRPATFSDVVGQEHVVQTLSNSIISGRVAHAFLFCGVRGVGKTTVARILAKALNCTGRPESDPNPCNECVSCREIGAGISVDVQEIDGASNTSVDNIREINENIKYPPVSSAYKIIIIDEVHMISINAFNALLKTLEEPPPHAKFIFATTESHKVPATINSRCQRFNFRTISLGDIVDGMARILIQEGIEAETNALELVAREAQGSFRDGLSLLDQVIALSPLKITAEEVTMILGIAGQDCFGRLMSAIFQRDPATSLEIVQELYQQGYDPEQFFLDLLTYIRNLTVMSTVPAASRKEGLIEAPPSEQEKMEELASQTTAEELQNLFAMLMKSESEIKRSANPWITLEMTVLKMVYAPQIVNLSEILKRIETGNIPEDTRRQVKVPAFPPPKQPRPVPKTEIRKPAADPPQPEPVLSDEHFTITEVTPLPTGTPDEIWSGLKRQVAMSGDRLLRSIMDHGSLLAFGPNEVEIGFHKEFYKDQFEKSIFQGPANDLFRQIFGSAKLKLLLLAQETTLATQKPYSDPDDGQTDLDRALKNEALDNPIVKSVLGEFEGSSIDEIRIITSKT